VTQPSTYHIHQLLHASLGEAVRELFASYGLPIEEAAPREPLLSAGDSVASSIGYSHPAVSGALTVIGSVTLVRALLVETGVDLTSVTDIHDACGEINNMLLGRVKNKCGRYGLLLKLGVPTTFYGSDLRMNQSSVPSLTSTWTAYNAAGDRFYVRLDILEASGFTKRMMRFKEVETPSGATEGDTLFFED
jgi:chemotaxis phosphatase CheX-like protein